MKFNTLLFAFVLLFSFLTSCKTEEEKKPDEMIIGTWRITDFKSTADFEKKELEELKNDLVKNVTYIFSKDKLVRKYADFESEWTWQLSDDNKKITLRSKDKNESMTIIKISDNEIVWKKVVAEEYEEITTWKKENTDKK